MKKSVKFGLAALSIAAAVPVFADEEVETENEYEAIGWTPIAIGIASPVQIPWGSHKWDIFGLGVNALWTDAPKMYGIGIGGVAMATRDDMMGIQSSGLCNWATKDVYGIRATIGANVAFGNVYGLDAGMFAYREAEMWGLDVEFIGSYQPKYWGLEIGGIVNIATEQGYGCAIAAGGNMAKVAYGVQISAIFNFTDELHGFQIGLVNFARECPWGLQLGLVNVIMDNSLKVLPLINFYF